MTTRSWSLLAALAALPFGCSSARSDAHGKPEPELSRTALPAPARDGGLSLAAALAGRHSVRSFGSRPLTETEVSQLVWAAQGISDGSRRTAPSAGALYPLEVRVVDARGVWRYVPEDHALARELADDRLAVLAAAGHDSQALVEAPAIVVLTARVAITARKYGARAERYAALEAGHAAQNLLLAATALGLGAVPVGSFDDAAVRQALALPREVTPYYLIPVGDSAEP